MWSRIEIVGVDVFTEVDYSGYLFGLFPGGLFAGWAQTDRLGWELPVLEVELVEFSLSVSVGFKRSDNINSTVLVDVFFSKFEVLGNFLTFSQKARFVMFIDLSISLEDFNLNIFFLSLWRLRLLYRLSILLLFTRLNIVINLRFADNPDSSSWLFIFDIILTIFDYGGLFSANWSTWSIDICILSTTWLIDGVAWGWWFGWVWGGFISVGLFGWRFWFCFFGTGIFSRLLFFLGWSSGFSGSSTEEKIIETFLGGSFFSIGIETSILVFRCWAIIIIDM